MQPAPVIHEERVAIVGAGPAGMTCARDLADLGYEVTVFEAQQVAGGMLRIGIPDYRLPHDVIQREIDQVLAKGIELKLGQRAGADFTVDGLFEQGYKAVYLATGLQKSADGAAARRRPRGRAPAPSSCCASSTSAARRPSASKVVVIGGGDVALDAARSAIRLQQQAGKEPDVTLVYRRTKVEMPANASEVEEARDEGLKVEFLVQPLAIAGDDGKVAGHQAAALRARRPRRVRPPPAGAVEGSEFELAADTVIFAVGQALVDDFAQGCDGLTLEKGQICVDRETMMTTREGVFAGGDAAAVGFYTAIEAVAAGRRGAAAIHNFLRGERLLPVWDDEREVARPTDEELAAIAVGQRVPMRHGRRPRSAAPTGTRSATATPPRRPWPRPSAASTAPSAASATAACAPAPAAPSTGTRTETIEDVTVGAVIVATGHQEFDARRKLPLGYGRYDNVLTQSQLGRLLAAAGPTAGELERPSDKGVPKNILMLQCVGSRDCQSNGNEHCSAICCLFATLHASLIKQHYPDAEVTIGYTDLRAPGKAHEEYYRLVQARGVRYVRGRVSEIIEEPDKSLRVRFEDTVTDKKNEELFDLVVLSAGLEASDGTADIARVAGLQTASAGFIKEYHPKLAPVDTQRTGMFVAGTAQGPKSIPDSIAQAKAAAARAISMLSTGFVLTPAQVAASDPEVCIACGVCETVCPQGAVHADHGRRRAQRGRPERLPRLRHLRRRVPDGRHPARRLQRRRGPGGGDGLMAAPGTSGRTVVAFCCRECAYAAADASANARTPLPPTVRLVLMPCTGRVSPLHMLSALAEGADGVMVAGCLEGQCHYREGNFNAIDRVTFVQRLLKSVGVEPERARMFTMSAGEPPKFVAAVKEMDQSSAACRRWSGRLERRRRARRLPAAT